MHQTSPEPGVPFRLRIGVTGHRRLPNPEDLASRIDEALDVQIPSLFDEPSRAEIRRSTRTPLAFSLLTPLAEGADRLMAETILRRPGATIEVVLPLTVEDYLEDFETLASRAEFGRLLALARHPISLRDAPLAADVPASKLAEARRQAYEDVGRYVVDHCDVLLALWDDGQPRGKGGTAEIVEYAKSIGRPVVAILAREHGGIETHSGTGISTEPFREIDAFNSFDPPETTVGHYIASTYRDLFENATGQGLLTDLKTVVREDLLPHYARASLIAKRNQRLYLAAGLVAYSFAALAVATVAAGALFWTSSPVVFGIELAIMAASFTMVLVANHLRTHRRWIENRFLAERLRAAAFLTACGLETSPASISYRPGSRRQPGDWTEMVFGEIRERMPTLGGCTEEACATETAFIREAWVESQIDYHDRKALRSRRMTKRMEVGGLVVFGLAILAPLLHLLLLEPLSLAGGAIGSDAGGSLGAALTFCALVLPAVGAAFGGIRMHREYSRLATRSADVASALKRLSTSLERVRTPRQLEAVARECEALMLLELQDWLSLTRHSVLEYVA
ncbi:MAG: hypothetical protein JXA87_04305 [Thermoleophilia bacterium]|nr:hypothetical protein [Thermoleophilia bacterium]